MRVTLESTPTLVEMEVDGHSVLARLWQGHAADNVPVVALIVGVFPQTDDADVRAGFGHDLVPFGNRQIRAASPGS
jgi:hypothetical protein